MNKEIERLKKELAALKQADEARVEGLMAKVREIYEGGIALGKIQAKRERLGRLIELMR